MLYCHFSTLHNGSQNDCWGFCVMNTHLCSLSRVELTNCNLLFLWNWQISRSVIWQIQLRVPSNFGFFKTSCWNRPQLSSISVSLTFWPEILIICLLFYSLNQSATFCGGTEVAIGMWISCAVVSGNNPLRSMWQLCRRGLIPRAELKRASGK